MNPKTIQKSIENKKQQIEKLNRDILELQKDLNKQKTIIINGVEYETKDHDFNLTFEQAIKLCPNGWRLWTIQECIDLYNNHKEEYKKVREIVNRELAIWQKAYPKQSLLLDKYTTKILVEIVLQLEEKDKNGK